MYFSVRVVSAVHMYHIWYSCHQVNDRFSILLIQLFQNWGKKGPGEKSRGSGGKLPPRFAKKQSTQPQQQQPPSSQSQPPVASAPSAQQQPPISAAQHSHLTPSQPPASPQTLEGPVVSLASTPSSTVDFTSKSLPSAPTQTHSALGTELWENKGTGSTVLPDVKKREWDVYFCFQNDTTFAAQVGSVC